MKPALVPIFASSNGCFCGLGKLVHQIGAMELDTVLKHGIMLMSHNGPTKASVKSRSRKALRHIATALAS